MRRFPLTTALLIDQSLLTAQVSRRLDLVLGPLQLLLATPGD
jgi:hypothetical protein